MCIQRRRQNDAKLYNNLILYVYHVFTAHAHVVNYYFRVKENRRSVMGFYNLQRRRRRIIIIFAKKFQSKFRTIRVFSPLQKPLIFHIFLRSFRLIFMS